MKDMHGEISEAKWMVLFTRGQISLKGSMAVFKLMEKPFEEMIAKLKQRKASQFSGICLYSEKLKDELEALELIRLN